MRFLDIFEYVSDERQMILDELRQSTIPLVLYGAGPNSRLVSKILSTNDIPIAIHCTDEEGLLYNPRLFPLEKVKDIFPKFNVFVSVFTYGIPERALAILPSSQVNKVYYIDFNEYMEMRGPLSKDFLVENEKRLEKVYSLLDDETSKKSYIAFIKSRISGNSSYMHPYIPKGEQYFDSSLVELSAKEYFVDCGAYDGDVERALFKLTNSKEHRIFAFEPDSKNREALHSYLSGEDIKNATVIPKGAWSKRGEMQFNDNFDRRTSINMEGTSKISVDSIDNLLKDEPISFIKMDIEGAELEALLGAKETIQRHKPVLAISMYHKNDDLYEIPLLIKEICAEYRLNIRLHAYAAHELILYAIAPRGGGGGGGDTNY